MNYPSNLAFLPAEAIMAFQEEALKNHIDYLLSNSPFYKSKLKELNKTTASLQNLPFTTKEELSTRTHEFLCVPEEEVVEYVTTSGTTSTPISIALTATDLERLAFNEETSLICAGANKKDLFQLTTTMDKQFMAGLAYYLGARKLGARVIRVGPGSPFLQWEAIKQYRPTYLVAIPSFIPKLIIYANENGLNLKDCGVKAIVCIGEPLRNPDFSLNELGRRIASGWDVKLYSTYASTEMASAFTECSEGKGGHFHPSLLMAEVVDENGMPAKEGELGEVVVTPLGVKAMPLLRYRTGDLCHVYYSPCACGRNGLRLGPVVGRKQQMIKFKGTTLFPPSIFDVLDKMKEIDLYQVEIGKDEFSNDTVTVLLPAELSGREFETELTGQFKSKLRVSPFIKFIARVELQGRVMKEDKRKGQKIIYVA